MELFLKVKVSNVFVQEHIVQVVLFFGSFGLGCRDVHLVRTSLRGG